VSKHIICQLSVEKCAILSFVLLQQYENISHYGRSGSADGASGRQEKQQKQSVQRLMHAGICLQIGCLCSWSGLVRPKMPRKPQENKNKQAGNNFLFFRLRNFSTPKKPTINIIQIQMHFVLKHRLCPGRTFQFAF